MRRIRPMELFQWKKTECPSCRYKDNCPKTQDYLIECYLEDKKVFQAAPELYLIKRAIRRTLFVKLRRGGTAGDPHSLARLRGIKMVQSPEPRFRGATLYCSDKELFKACQPSG